MTLPVLYATPQLCYNPIIEHTVSLPGFPPNILAQFPVFSFGQQETVFAAAFEILQQAIAQHAFPGSSVAVTSQGKLVALKAFGRFTYEPDSPEVTPASIFDLASLTKVVSTTTMAMILYERGQLDLDMPVVSLVPEFRSEDSRRSEVTVRQLLSHSSGLPAYEKLFLKTRTRGDLVDAACSASLTSDPGTKTEYSDIGFIILGLALERLAEDSLDHFCQHEVFGPLGMMHTAFRPPATWQPIIPPTADDQSFRHRIIQGEVQDENASVMGGVAAHAGLFADAKDIAIFAHALLQGGRPILRPETVSLFTRRETSPPGTSCALGWDTPSQPSQSGKHFSATSFGHLGYTGTSLWIDPQRQLSVTLLTNRTWPDCKNEAIKQARPAFHDAVVEALEE